MTETDRFFYQPGSRARKLAHGVVARSGPKGVGGWVGSALSTPAACATTSESGQPDEEEVQFAAYMRQFPHGCGDPQIGVWATSGPRILVLVDNDLPNRTRRGRAPRADPYRR